MIFYIYLGLLISTNGCFTSIFILLGFMNFFLFDFLFWNNFNVFSPLSSLFLFFHLSLSPWSFLTLLSPFSDFRFALFMIHHPLLDIRGQMEIINILLITHLTNLFGIYGSQIFDLGIRVSWSEDETERWDVNQTSGRISSRFEGLPSFT